MYIWSSEENYRYVILDQSRQHIKKQRHYFANKVSSSQSFGFPSSHVGCESWTIKKSEC